jgi:polyhydroxyalkanoate synthase
MVDVEQLMQELAAASAKMAAGFAAINRLEPVQVGACARTAIHHERTLTLYHYAPLVPVDGAVPLLIVSPLVNRPYMVDLQPGRSLVEGLLRQGLDVYLIDWGYPDPIDRFITLADYIDAYIDHCEDVIRDRCETDRINVMGICQGGTLAVCYSVLHQPKVANLIATITPVDFHTTDDMLSHLVRHVDIDRLVATHGNVPGAFLNMLFLALKPFRLQQQKYVELIDICDDPDALRNFVRTEKWIFDSPDQAGTAFAEFVTRCYHRNELIDGRLTLGGRAVRLDTLRLPVLNIFARDDHLVPPAASKALQAAVGTTDYTEIEFPGGHVGLYISRRSQQTLPAAIAAWLRARQIKKTRRS